MSRRHKNRQKARRRAHQNTSPTAAIREEAETVVQPTDAAVEDSPKPDAASTHPDTAAPETKSEDTPSEGAEETGPAATASQDRKPDEATQDDEVEVDTAKPPEGTSRAEEERATEAASSRRAQPTQRRAQRPRRAAKKSRTAKKPAVRTPDSRAKGARAGRRNLLWIGIGAVVALVIVGVLIFANQQSGGGSGAGGSTKIEQALADPNSEAGREVAEQVAKNTELLRGIEQQGKTLGDPEAAVEIVEFADLLCPACAEFERTSFSEIVTQQVKTGQARYRWETVPLLGPDSFTAVTAAYAAEQQNKLYEYTMLWLQFQPEGRNDYVTDAYMDAVAEAAGLNVEQFRADRISPEAQNAASDTQILVLDEQINGTPTVRVEAGEERENLGAGVFTPEQIAEAVQKLSGQ